MTYVAIAAVGGVLWVTAVVLVLAVGRAAAGSRLTLRNRPGKNPNSNSLLGRSSPPSRAVASSTAREAGEVLIGS